MAFRDDLDAAHARISELKQELKVAGEKNEKLARPKSSLPSKLTGSNQ